MQRQDFWYNSDAERIGAIPTGCKAGQFLFLSAQTPVELETGALIRYPWDLPPEGRECIMTGREFYDSKNGPVRAQTWMIYNNLSKILAQQGSSLQNVVRQRIYLRDVNDTGSMEEVMLSFFQDDKPATMIAGVANQGLASDMRVQVEVIALVPEERGLHTESIYLPDLALVTAPYPQAVKVGQFLFFSGLVAIDPATGKIVTRLEELGNDAAHVRSGYLQTDSTQEASKAQYYHINRLMEQVIKNQGGAGYKDMLRLNQFYRYGMKANADRTALIGKLFKNIREDVPPNTAFGIRNVSVIDEAMIVGDAVALLPGEYHKEVAMGGSAGIQPTWSKAGPFWFVSGDLGWNRAKHDSIHSFSDLTDAGRFLAQGRFHDVHTEAMAQAWYTYQSLDRQMHDAGSELAKVVQQNLYMRDVSEYLAVERIASIVYKGRIPPTILVPVDDIGSYGERLEIETISLV